MGQYLWAAARKAIPAFWRDQSKGEPKDLPSPVSPTSPESPPPPKRMNPPKPIWIDPEMRKAEEEAAAAMAKRSHSIAMSQPIPQVQTLSDEDEEDRRAIEDIVNPATRIAAVATLQGFAQRRASRQATAIARDISRRLEQGNYQPRKIDDDERTLVDEVDWADPIQVAARKASWQEFSISNICGPKDIGDKRQSGQKLQVDAVDSQAQQAKRNTERIAQLPFGHPYADLTEALRQQSAPEIGPRPPTDAERRQTGRRRASDVLSSFLPPPPPIHDFPAIGRRRWSNNDDIPFRATWRSTTRQPLLLPDVLEKNGLSVQSNHRALLPKSAGKLPGTTERLRPGPSRRQSRTPLPYRHSHNPVTKTHKEEMFIITTREIWRHVRRASAPEPFHLDHPTRHVDDPEEGTRRGIPVALKLPLSAHERCQLLVTLSNLDQHLKIHMYRGCAPVFPTLFNQNRRRSRRITDAAVTTYDDFPNVLDSGRDLRRRVFERYLSRFAEPQFNLLRRFRNPEDDPRGHIGSWEHKEPPPDNDPPLARSWRDMQGDLAEREAIDGRRRVLGDLPRYSSGTDRGRGTYGGYSPETGRKAKTVVTAAKRRLYSITKLFEPGEDAGEPSERRPSVSGIAKLFRRGSIDTKRQQKRPRVDEHYIGTYQMLKKDGMVACNNQGNDEHFGFRMPRYDAAATEQAIEEECEPGVAVSDRTNERQSRQQNLHESTAAQTGGEESAVADDD
ncbi:hypothetical protein M409DRAFT_27039 [Zasmidium cellare ATCC 36951]|uniref:Uncharacterized protein n=1 Tax=Zasmidium cellare ATCC 36951 TaxID=1080233 RepID=A0A6A6C5N4_ZASCE|nr:uncharacterized protein M409DRAFT_27039 [Zasmidium cellare ATCC 36951]KAF2162414.1 hypothetical protein M409DRAFT_27039 [Zasmidium cellare ATCC 36951]